MTEKKTTAAAEKAETAEKTAAKKTAAKKTASRKPTAKKPAAKKSDAKKTAAKKTPAKTAVKTTGAAAKKTAAKKAPSRRKQTLVIVESPAKAKTISKYLGSSYKVEASQGHVRDLPKSQLGIDVQNDFDMKYITIRGRGDILKQIRNDAQKASRVYLATDPDREGEAISWHLAQVLGIDPESNCRIEFHEVTEKAVKSAVAEPRPIDRDLVDAQQTRRALDRLVGYSISPLLWAKVKKGLSAGRVQSVATKMVVSREQEIEEFIPEENWTIEAQAESGSGKGKKNRFSVRLSGVDGKPAEIHDSLTAQALADRIKKSRFKIAAVHKAQRKKNPTPPFTTSTLQQEASRKLNFTTSKTMQIVQQLYEGIDLGSEGTQGLVTYIRTDSVRVSDSALAAVRTYIPQRFGAEYLPEKPNEYKGRKNAQDAHEAIRPTYVMRTPEKIHNYLSRDQYRLYDLIYKRFVASQMMPAVYDTMSADVAGDGLNFRFYGEHKIFAGFTALYEESTDEAQESEKSRLPALHEGAETVLSEIDPEQHFTEPPARYTEASLVKALEEQGIGRPSTYAPTISVIITRGYVSREKKRLYPTELGILVTRMMDEYFRDIVDIKFTATMEDKLDKVEEGEIAWKKVLEDFWPQFEKELRSAESRIEKVDIKDEISDVPCDKCGAMMVYKMGRFGKFLACPNFPACHNAKPILKYIDVPCPKCGGRLMEKTSRKNRIFYGCEQYPACDFVSWEKPVAEHCPHCGSWMTEKRSRKGEVWHVCANEKCRYSEELPAVTENGEEE